MDVGFLWRRVDVLEVVDVPPDQILDNAVNEVVYRVVVLVTRVLPLRENAEIF